MSKQSFGKAFRDEFFFEPGYVPINHGSFGVYPKAIKPILREFQDKAEEHPDRWNRYEMFSPIQASLDRIAQLIHCNSSDLAFVPNASQAANTVLRSFPFKEGDKILYYHTTYISVNKTLEFLRDHLKVKLVGIEINYPIEDADMIDLTKQAIEREHAKEGEPKIRLAVIDALCSLPGARLPFEALTKTVQEHGILAMIDGAHAIGQIPLNLSETDPDFFFSNCHKWLYTPRGCAILYVPKRNQGFVHPTTINYAYKFHEDASDSSTFALEHAPNTIDPSSYMCVKAAIEYRESIGGEEAINAYCHDIAVKGGDLVAKKLGTSVMENSTKTLTANMVNVELPAFKTSKSDAEIVSFFMKKAVYDHHTMFPIYKNNDRWWVRLCGQVYVDLDDFEYVGNALLAIIHDINE